MIFTFWPVVLRAIFEEDVYYKTRGGDADENVDGINPEIRD